VVFFEFHGVLFLGLWLVREFTINVRFMASLAWWGFHLNHEGHPRLHHSMTGSEREVIYCLVLFGRFLTPPNLPLSGEGLGCATCFVYDVCE